MGAQMFTLGPQHLYVRLRDNATYYLGTAVAAPEPEAERLEIPVLNDIGGRSVPFDVVMDGEEHLVIATLNRFNYTNYKRIRSLHPGGLGVDAAVDRGLLVFGKYDFELIVVNTYAASALANPLGEAPTYRRYYSSRLQKYKESAVGTRVQEIALVIRCSNLYNPTTREFGLYTENPSQIGTIPDPE